MGERDERNDRNDRNDRELDDYLRGGSRLSAAYREARGEEPPADLDEVLLERARRELRLGPKVAWSPFTRAWSWPLRLAAVLVVSVSVTLVMYEETGEPLLLLERPATDGPAVPQSPAREAAPAPSVRPMPAPAPKQAPPATAAPAQVPAAPMPFPAEQGDSAKRQQRDRAADAAREAAPAAGREAGSAAPAMPAAPSALRAEEKAIPAPRAKREAAPDADLGADPEIWVRRIETLRREGRHAEADALLAEFRKRFPDYPADRLPK